MGLIQSQPKWWTDFPPLRRQIISWLMVLAVGGCAVWSGIEFRSWIYEASGERNIRFHGDLIGAWYRGSQVVWSARRQAAKTPGRSSFSDLMRGYLVRFDEAMAEKPKGDYEIDYPPARLLIMAIWMWHITPAGGQITPEQSEPLDGPLLWTNTGFELAAALLAFLVVRRVLRRNNNPWADGVALLSAIFLWFNFPMILDAHVWPQWDAWAIPFYLFAAWLALGHRWLACGMCMGVGAMFKGQILLTLPIFILWPLFQRQWRAALDVIVGMLFTAMLYVFPWMVRSVWGGISLTVLMGAAVFGYSRIRSGWRATYFCAAIGLSLLITGLVCGGSFGWWYVGFAYGIRHRLVLTVHAPSNLSAIMSRYDWKLLDPVFSIGQFDITLRMVLISLYVVSLLICGWAVARHDRRQDRRVLLALATPWIALFAFLPQMHERYFIWGAAISALAVGVSLGATLLHLVVSFIACLPLGFMLYSVNKLGDTYAPTVHFFQQSAADVAWVTVLVTLIFLYLSVTSSPSPARSLEHLN